jgi:hypothetical protein
MCEVIDLQLDRQTTMELAWIAAVGQFNKCRDVSEIRKPFTTRLRPLPRKIVGRIIKLLTPIPTEVAMIVVEIIRLYLTSCQILILQYSFPERFIKFIHDLCNKLRQLKEDGIKGMKYMTTELIQVLLGPPYPTGVFQLDIGDEYLGSIYQHMISQI